jgi:NADP-dependent 3-hydroxy acid dehydrogenase YdfG
MSVAKGPVVLTTGANSGIGLATVIELARKGFDSVGSVRSAAKAREVVRAAREAGVRVRTVRLDVTDTGGSARVIDELQPYGLVNNAGYSVTGAIEDVDDEEAHRAMETMVFAPMRLARLALPHMRASGEGRIVVWQESSGDIARRRGSRYETAYRRAEQSTRLTQALMGDPRMVARTIVRAMTSRSPRPRYLVGYDAQAISFWDRFLPTEVKDRLAQVALGL